jgi:asparagine synthetase B (glutamine-hydrolysing)
MRTRSDGGRPRHTALRMADGHGFELLLMHNLLDISGHAARQPVVSGDNQAGTLQVLLFNGEIYNYDRVTHDSDTAFLASRLQSHADTLGRMLDGEYAILHYSQQQQELLIITDPFLTKPLYLGRKTESADFGVASYASTLRTLGFNRLEMVAPNTTVHVGFASGQPVLRVTDDGAFAFDLRQHKTDFSGWEASFLDAVHKRHARRVSALRQPIFGLRLGRGVPGAQSAKAAIRDLHDHVRRKPRRDPRTHPPEPGGLVP